MFLTGSQPHQPVVASRAQFQPVVASRAQLVAASYSEIRIEINSKMDFFSPYHLEQFANALLQFPLTLARFAHKILWATIDILWTTIDILLDTIDILFLRFATVPEETSITISPSGFRIRAGSSYMWKPLTVCLFATVVALFALTRTGEGYNGMYITSHLL